MAEEKVFLCVCAVLAPRRPRRVSGPQGRDGERREIRPFSATDVSHFLAADDEHLGFCSRNAEEEDSISTQDVWGWVVGCVVGREAFACLSLLPYSRATTHTHRAWIHAHCPISISVINFVLIRPSTKARQVTAHKKLESSFLLLNSLLRLAAALMT